jgi:hypothetical protein
MDGRGDVSDTTDARALATWLSGRDDAALEELFRLRGVAPSAPWHDFFDVAEGLLDPASIDRALAATPRAELVSLAAGGAPDLTSRALTRPDGVPYAAVAARVAEARSARPDAFEPDAPAPAPTPASEKDAAAAAERIFRSLSALTDIVAASLDAPVSTTAAGTVSASDRRALVENHVVDDGDALDDLLSLGADTGLLRPTDREWRVTEHGERWLSLPALERWDVVARAYAASLPRGVRPVHGYLPYAAWENTYPLDPGWPIRAAALRRRAQRWGLLIGDDEPAWATALRVDGVPDTAALAALLPAEIDRIYLQADLTAIAPGPLRSDLDLRLRGMAARESRAQASTYRFTEETVGAAVAGGETEDSIRGFLEDISLTGIPQPLAYLVERAAARHGLVRVGMDEVTGRTRVDSEDDTLLRALAVDQSVRSIGLVEASGALETRVPRDAVYWTLADARYPVVALDPDGRPEPLRRRRALLPAEAAEPAAHAGLVIVLRASADTESDAAWLERELEQAVRARSIVTVDVRLPDGSTRALTMEASGLGGGRFRGLDRAADVERTLPVSSIAAVRLAPIAEAPGR